MTHVQFLAFAILAAMMAAFGWGRLRYDVVAALALIAAVLLGVVPYEAAFSGFGDDIVIIVASALVVSAAVERSGVVEAVLHRVSPNVTSPQAQIVLLVGAVTVLSAFVKNIGALAMLMPAAFQMARRSNSPPSAFLMPMAFGSLLGGLVTLVGTSPNIIVSRMRAELSGTPFGMFDFTPVGVGLAAAGVMFLAVGYRLLPVRAKTAATLDEALDVTHYTTETRVAADSAVLGKTVGELIALSADGVVVIGVLRGDAERVRPLPDVVLQENDVVLLQGDPEALERVIGRARLQLEGAKRRVESGKGAADEVAGIEAVVAPKSILVGRTAKRLALHERFDINLLAVSRSGERFTQRLRDINLMPGDVLVLKGDLGGMPDKLRDLGLLPLASRQIRLGNVRHGLAPVAILGGAMLLTAFGVLPVATAFFCAAVAMVVTKTLSLREAYDAVDWPILVMLATLIPISEAIRSTGGADLIAHGLYDLAGGLPAYAALALIMATAMLVTPFLNNAATVLVMAPIAATFAGDFGYNADAFLMAVAVGAGCDFLTPIGHQCNTLVMGPGGYRFGDYWKLGLPLTLLVLALGVPLILAVWPLRGV
jgi:di/tricarboxylate transporter